MSIRCDGTVLGTLRGWRGAQETKNHAVVIGASIAGLCAARVLSDFYSRVTVYERDELPSTPANRATVPQDRHLHLLMARGANEFESLLPGSAEGHGGRGCADAGEPAGLHPSGRGGPRPRAPGTPCATSSPPMCPAGRIWNGSLRERVLDIDNVEIVRRHVAEPRFDRARQRVTGVLLGPADAGQASPNSCAADLVVDAAGRGTRLPVWLTQWGYAAPPRRNGGHRHQLRHPAIPDAGRPDRGKGGGRRRLP